MAAIKQKYVRVELKETTIAQLISNGVLCAADFRCLDCHAKDCIWRSVLDSCKPGSTVGRVNNPKFKEN